MEREDVDLEPLPQSKRSSGQSKLEQKKAEQENTHKFECFDSNQDILLEAKICSKLALEMIESGMYEAALDYLQEGQVNLDSCKGLCYDLDLRVCLLNNWALVQQRLHHSLLSSKCIWTIVCELEKALEQDLPQYNKQTEKRTQITDIRLVCSFLRRKQTLAFYCIKYVDSYFTRVLQDLERSAFRACVFMRQVFKGCYDHFRTQNTSNSETFGLITTLKLIKKLAEYPLELVDSQQDILLISISETLQKINEQKPPMKDQLSIADILALKAKAYEESNNQQQIELNTEVLFRIGMLLALGYFFQAKILSNRIEGDRGKLQHLAAIDICLMVAPYQSKILKEMLTAYTQFFNESLWPPELFNWSEPKSPISTPNMPNTGTTRRSEPQFRSREGAVNVLSDNRNGMGSTLCTGNVNLHF